MPGEQADDATATAVYSTVLPRLVSTPTDLVYVSPGQSLHWTALAVRPELKAVQPGRPDGTETHVFGTDSTLSATESAAITQALRGIAPVVDDASTVCGGLRLGMSPVLIDDGTAYVTAEATFDSCDGHAGWDHYEEYRLDRAGGTWSVASATDVYDVG